MAPLAILRTLWRRRLLLALGFALSVLAGILMAYSLSGFPPTLESRQYVVGVATASVLVDSASSQVADLGGAASRADIASLSVRARLLANLLSTSPLREQIAARAKISPETLIAIAPQDQAPFTPVVSPGATVSENDRRASVLNLSVRDAVPIITAAVRAPDRESANRLAAAAIAELENYLRGVTVNDKVPDARRLVLEPLGPAHSAVQTRGPRRLVGMLATLALFGLWCAGILACIGVARGWKQAAALESKPVETEQPPPRPAVAARAGALAAVVDPPAFAGVDPAQVLELPERPWSVALPRGSRPALVPDEAPPERPERPIAARGGRRPR